MADVGPRKRRRPAKSCEQCRHRKVRCDRSTPCGPCTRARDPLRCSYRQPQFHVSAGASGPPGVGPDQILEFAPSHLTPASPSDRTESGWPGHRSGGLYSPSDPAQPVRDVQQRLQALEEQLSSAGTSNPNRSLDQALRELTAKVESIEKRLSANSTRSETGRGQGLSVDEIRPRVHVTTDKVKFLGRTHWMRRVDKLQITQPFSRQEQEEPSFLELKADIASLVKECKGLRQSIKSQHSVRLNDPVPDLRSTIPTRPICDELVHHYLRTFEAIYRVIHIPSFWKEYEKFWDQPQSSPTHFLMKLVLILAIGATFSSQRQNPINDEYFHLAQTWIYAAQWWLTGPTEKSTFNLDGLQVCCLLLISRKTSALGPSPWLSTGSLVRMAMAMGLHRDSSNFPYLSPFQSEMRARLWATVLELDLQSSLDSGTPPLLHASDLESRKPLNINDQDLTPNMTAWPVPKSKDQFTESSIQILLHQSMRLRTRTLHLIHGNNTSRSYTETLQLAGDLKAACRQIASFFHSPTIAHRLEAPDFHRKLLDMELRRYILALHIPFMFQARTDMQYYYSRKACIESAMVIASYGQTLNLPSKNLDDFSRLTIIGRGPFKSTLGLDIISVLGLEIITQLGEHQEQQQEEAAAHIQTLTPHSIPDPVDELSKANRAPLMRSLEHILDQLLQIISLGCPSMKRYNFLAAVLGQIRAMESGEYIKRVVYERVKESLEKCSTLLRPFALGVSVGESVLALSTQISNTPNVPIWPEAEFSSANIDLDQMLNLDFPSLLGFSSLDDMICADF